MASVFEFDIFDEQIIEYSTVVLQMIPTEMEIEHKLKIRILNISSII